MKDLVKVIRRVLSIFLSSKDSVSSKRVMGVSAWVVVLICYYKCSVAGTQMPNATDMIVGTASAMLGLDSFVKIFQKGEKKA